MKKIFILLTSIVLLTSCAGSVALLGPASSIAGGGNIVHSSLSSAASYGVKKATGKSPMQHVLAYAEESNPNKNKDRCISFVKRTESEACYIAKRQISSVKKSTSKKIKNIITPSKFKIVKKNKLVQELSLYTEPKKLMVQKTQGKTLTVKKNKIDEDLQLKSIESMLVESAMSKKQINHLQVSIKKDSKIKD